MCECVSEDCESVFLHLYYLLILSSILMCFSHRCSKSFIHILCTIIVKR